MPDARRVEALINNRILDSGDAVDVRGLISDFRITVIRGENGDDTVVGHLYETLSEDRNERRFIRLRKGLSEKEENTIFALLLASYCLNESKMKKEGYRLSIFDLKNVRENRFSRMMYLATRFALPEKLIARMDDVIFGNIKVKARDMFTSDFIFSSVKGPTIAFLLENNIT